MSSIMRRRNGLVASSVMGMLLSWVKVANPSSQDRTPRCAILSAALPAVAPYRASGLVLWPEGEDRHRVRHVGSRGQTRHREGASKSTRMTWNRHPRLVVERSEALSPR